MPKPDPRPVTSIALRSVADQVYQHLSQLIVTGQLKPGERLRIQELAKCLGVSDTPVREALMRLQHNGLVEIYPRSETRVRVFTERDIEEVYELREALECYAVKQAVKRLTDEELNSLSQLFAEAGEDIRKDGEAARLVAADVELHAQIVRTTDNVRISSLIANLQDQSQLFRHLGIRNPDVPLRFLEIHQQLIAALVHRDQEAAIRLMEEHMRLTKEQAVEDYLKAYP